MASNADMSLKPKVSPTLEDADLFRQATDAVEEAVCILDADMNIRYQNHAHMKRHGLADATEYRFGGKCFAVLKNRKTPCENCPVLVVLKTAAPNTTILPDETDPEKITWAEYSISPVFDEKHTLMGAVKVIRDVTELKKTEARLRETTVKLEFYAKKLHYDNEKSQRLANSDPLTRIANRRRFDDYLKEQWQIHKVSKKPLSLLLCDIDHFKRYNDYYGHLTGDLCLIAVAKVLRRSLRSSDDLAARYGGEEFAAILPETDAADAVQVAQTLQRLLKMLKIGHADSRTAPFVTISIGISTVVPRGGITPEALIHVADKALYEAKTAGRNRYIVKTELKDLKQAIHQTKATSEIKRRQEQYRRRLEETVKKVQKLFRSPEEIDPLTRVANRRKFIQALGREWKDRMQSGTPLSLILCEIDHFNLYTHIHGRPESDKVLGQIAETFGRELTTSEGFAARIGGYTFAGILPGQTGMSAADLAKEVRKQVLALDIEFIDSPTAPYITVSMGVTSLQPTPENSPGLLAQLADEALYEARGAGHDRVFWKNGFQAPPKPV